MGIMDPKLLCPAHDLVVKGVCGDLHISLRTLDNVYVNFNLGENWVSWTPVLGLKIQREVNDGHCG